MSEILPVGRLARLAAEVEVALKEIIRLVEACSALPVRFSARPPDVLELNGCGKALHDLYLGIERALLRIARELGGVPAGDSWHRDLLEDASLDVQGVRPAILQASTVTELRPLLSFRHRYRNLYFFDLEWQQVHARLERVAALGPAVERDLRAFIETLRHMDRAMRE
jgi:hypothetical protein